MLRFRDLRADEIECRVSTCSEKGVSLLLYKDARCDMNILDETVGPMNWKREHLRDNANCIVSIWDGEKKIWVSKEDTGIESNTAKEKGLASDSFKRACFNWGIGRELYTAPSIWINSDDVEIRTNPRNQNAFTTYDRFRVKEIEIRDKRIISLSIVKEKTNKMVFHYGNSAGSTFVPDTPQEKEETLDEKYVKDMRNYIKSNGLDEKVICRSYRKKTLKEFTSKQFQSVIDEKYLGYWKQQCGVV